MSSQPQNVQPMSEPVIGRLPPPATAKCRECEQLKPATAEWFCLKDDGTVSEQPICRGCIATAKLRKQDERRAEAVKNATAQLVSACRRNQLNAPHIAELYAGMVAEFKGCDKLCAAWKAQIDRAIEDKPGSKTVLDQFYAIFKMGQAVGDQVGTDVGTLTDEELCQELAAHLAEFLPDVYRPPETTEEGNTQDDVDGIAKSA